MTREQAIEILNQRECCRECVVNNGDCNDCDKAFEMAIKALEQQPSEDCVSRQAVLDEIKSMSNANPSYWATCDVIDREDLIDSIKDLPPVTPTRKKGEWCKQNDDYFDWYECSECGYGSEGEMQYSSECDVRTNYCPNCGAEMI